MAKKNEFLNRAAMFQPKTAPSQEETKARIQKEASERKFGKQLSKALQFGPKTTPAGHAEAEEERQDSRPPAPAPFVRLPMPGTKPPPPAAPPARQQQPEPEPEVKVFSGWVYVFEGEATPYYWNMLSNDTTFTPPPEYNGELYVGGEVVAPQPPAAAAPSAAAASHEDATPVTPSVVLWQEVEGSEGEGVYYLNTFDSSVTYERPVGDVYVVVQAEGAEEYWQQLEGEDGALLYVSLSSGEHSSSRPEGGITIISQAL